MLCHGRGWGFYLYIYLSFRTPIYIIAENVCNTCSDKKNDQIEISDIFHMQCLFHIDLIPSQEVNNQSYTCNENNKFYYGNYMRIVLTYIVFLKLNL